MIFHPVVIALLVGATLTCGMLLYAAYYGARILRRWDLGSGSDLQLSLERRTYLVSTLMSYAMGFQILSLFLFVYTAEEMARFIVGAMCAAGSLHANLWGYPALVLKIITSLLAGTWLVVNGADNRGYDYPLIKKKYALLLLIAPIGMADLIAQAGYFLGLNPDVITSCCGSLFTFGTGQTENSIAALPRGPAEILFYAGMGLVFTTGVAFYRTGRGGYLFSLASTAALLISVNALIAFISPYFYELPGHHCPFCILQKEYGYIGYPLYLALMTGAVAGLGVGATLPYRQVPSLKVALPALQRRLALAGLIAFLCFTALSVYGVLSSNLSLARLETPSVLLSSAQPSPAMFIQSILATFNITF